MEKFNNIKRVGCRNGDKATKNALLILIWVTESLKPTLPSIYFFYGATTLIQSLPSQQYPSTYSGSVLFCPLHKLHLLQTIPDIIFPSILWLFCWSSCEWFPFVYSFHRAGFFFFSFSFSSFFLFFPSSFLWRHNSDPVFAFPTISFHLRRPYTVLPTSQASSSSQHS